MSIFEILQKEFDMDIKYVKNTIELLDDGNTIPFIARYRKELTGSLDDQVLRNLANRLSYLRNMEDTREQYRASIDEAGKLTDELKKQLEAAQTLAQLEDIYRPFRPKRRTRATMAIERGLQPLADIIFEQSLSEPAEHLAATFINAERGVETVEAAIAGAMDIIAENISDSAINREIIRKIFSKSGLLTSVAVKPEEKSVYEIYYEFSEPITKLPGYRILAINRGEKEGFLKVGIDTNIDEILNRLNALIVKKNPYTESLMRDAITDAYKRLMQPSIEREIRNNCTEKAEEGAISLFGENLRQLLMISPIKEKTVLAIDPGFRTGCKVCIIDGIGNVKFTATVYPTPPASRIQEAKKLLLPAMEKFAVDIIAIGNGTGSRETESFVADMLKDTKREIYYTIVNEAGASVYSASKLAAEEFPEFDVSLRSAVSIGRRLQDPLSELVKIDPQSIGVGQYQHDMNQKRMRETLGGVVEACVNSVGVDLNRASPSLLSYVAGISATVAKNILMHRQENGKFKNRKELLKVKGLGPKAFEQCAGFLRIIGGENALDATGVHPESYDITLKLLEEVGFDAENIKAGETLSLKSKIALEPLSGRLGIGIPTLKDILAELEKPGRDPRENMPTPALRNDILEITDLEEGMQLSGVVRNIMDFGAFVDIGVHQDGLIHISQMSDKFIKHPLEIVKIGDIINVCILSVDIEKKRIALKLK